MSIIYVTVNRGVKVVFCREQIDSIRLQDQNVMEFLFDVMYVCAKLDSDFQNMNSCAQYFIL